jgi:CRISPR/Cas system-associated exonuclease Cas4 (RecB family)
MPYKFSPSSLNLLKECPRCFWLHFNKGIRRPRGIFPSLPSGMDKILKEHFDAFMERGKLPPELAGLEGDVRLFEDVELLGLWRNNFKGIQWEDEDGNRLRGAVDNILQKKKKLIVLDYKTRGYPLKEDTAHHYQDQLNFYNFLLRKNGYKTENYAYLLFYHPDKVSKKGNIAFHTDLVKMKTSVKDAEKVFKEALALLEGDMPEHTGECEYCKWASKSQPNSGHRQMTLD